MDTIRRYASMFGLNRPSGIEIPETTPELTTEDPERSAMGQGTNSYSNVQLSRYVAAIANSGTVFDLSLLDKMTDSEGKSHQGFHTGGNRTCGHCGFYLGCGASGYAGRSDRRFR